MPKKYLAILTGIFIFFGLYLAKLYSYLLFHSIAEIFCVLIAFIIFVITWNSKQFIDNSYLVFLGIAFLFFGIINLVHLLAYKGMGVFQGYGTNLPTQLWIAGRYVQSFSLLFAPLLLDRKLKINLVLLGYAAITLLLFVSIFYWGIFPDCFIEGTGLTIFKKHSEYIICLILLASLFLLYRKRQEFNLEVLRFLLLFILLNIVSELAFTLYTDVYGFFNLIGHFLQVIAFYLVYRALIETGLKRPYSLLFRNLAESAAELRQAKENLELRVAERTMELHNANKQLQLELIERRQAEQKASRLAAIVESSDDAIIGKTLEGTITSWNRGAEKVYGYRENEVVGKPISILVPPGLEDEVQRILAKIILGEYVEHYETVRRRKDGQDIYMSIAVSPIRDEEGKIVAASTIGRDISERKRAEEALHRLNRELRAVSDCNEALMRAVDEQTLVKDICRIINDVAGYRMVWVGYPQNDDAKTVHPVAWAGVEGGYLATANITWADTEHGRGPTGIAIRSGKTICIQDVTMDPQVAPWRENALQRGYRSSIALPLKDEHANVFGVLNIYSTEPNDFTPDEMRLMEELAGDLAFGIMVLRARIASKQAERSIALLSFALNNVHEAAFLADEKGRFHYVNEESCRTLGYTRDELLGLCVADIDPDYPIEHWPSHWDDLKAKHSLTFETCHKAKNGCISPVEISANYFEYDGQGYNLALVRDITQRKRVEEAVAVERQRFLSLLEAMPAYLGLMTPDYRVAFANLKFREQFGEPGGRRCFDYMFGRSEPCENCQAFKVLETKKEEYEWVGPDGRIYQICDQLVHDTDGSPLILEMGLDITERKQMEQALVIREREYRTLLENIPDLIVRYDKDLHRIYVNPAWEKLSGLPSVDVVGKPAADTPNVPQPAVPEYAEKLRQVAETGSPKSIEFTWVNALGATLFLEYVIVPEYDRAGEIVSVLSVGRDLTERRRIEEEIRQLNLELEDRVRDRTAQLEAANQELEAFAYSVSHDLRAPLRHIDGFLELLQTRTATLLDEKSQHYMADIFDSSRRMGQLIDDLLSFSRMGRYEMSKMDVDLGAMVKEVIQQLEPETLGRSIRWRIADLPVVQGDRAMLRVVLVNLISNALKFTRPRPQAEIDIGCLADRKREITIYIRDNGVGFDMNYADKLFGVFQRLHRLEEFEGTGIGLANVRRIIHRHGGRTWGEGKVNQGATFYFSLP